jgi:hypothetical protein
MRKYQLSKEDTGIHLTGQSVGSFVAWSKNVGRNIDRE